MQRVLEVSSAQKPRVLIEIDETQIETVLSPGQAGDVALEKGAQDAVEKLRDIGESIAEACGSINDAVRDRLRDAKPDEFTLEFGVKVGAEGGAIISKVTGEAALKVTATWRADVAPAS
jgi:hypothetical protein